MDVLRTKGFARGNWKSPLLTKSAAQPIHGNKDGQARRQMKNTYR